MAGAPKGDSPCASIVQVNKGLKLYILTLLILNIVAVSVVCIHHYVLHKPQTRELLFCCSAARFSDFTDLDRRVAHFGEPNMLVRTDVSYPYPYPVPSIYAFLFFHKLFANPLAAYLAFVILCFIVATAFLSLHVFRVSHARLPAFAVWSTLLLTYPLFMLLDRGNIEGVIWVLILLGLLAFTRNKLVITAIMWSAAASMKIFPGLLFALFLAKRKYRMFAVAITTTVAFTVLALIGVGPSLHQAALDSTKSASFVKNGYILARQLLQFDHSLFAAVKQTIHLYAVTFHGRDYLNHEREPFRQALRWYSIAAPLGAVLLWWFRLRRMPLMNQFISYVVLAILLPYVSNEYTLTHIYLVWAAFLIFLVTDVSQGRASISSKAIHLILISCAVIFAPIAYLQVGHAIRFGGQVKTVCLLLLLVTVLRNPMPSSLFGDLEEKREELTVGAA